MKSWTSRRLSRSIRLFRLPHWRHLFHSLRWFRQFCLRLWSRPRNCSTPRWIRSMPHLPPCDDSKILLPLPSFLLLSSLTYATSEIRPPELNSGTDVSCSTACAADEIPAIPRSSESALECRFAENPPPFSRPF